jgi:hypothetical protein
MANPTTIQLVLKQLSYNKGLKEIQLPAGLKLLETRILNEYGKPMTGKRLEEQEALYRKINGTLPQERGSGHSCKNPK